MSGDFFGSLEPYAPEPMPGTYVRRVPPRLRILILRGRESGQT